MCGIAGFCNHPTNWRENIHRMNERMLHRGPDAGGFWANEDASVVFGHRRLSIVDLSENGAQPMQSASGRYMCVYNGEIYNYKVIRDKLLAEHKVTAFRGTSDTEVLLEAFEAYGVRETIAMCKGMFAIALLDRQTKKLTLIRDRIGEKPLYYGFVNGHFAFASDLGSITQLDDFHNAIDTKVLQIYFVHGYIPAPYSIYENIYKLDAGCMLELDAPYTEPKISAYWSVREAAKYGETHPFKGTREEAADELEKAEDFDTAVHDMIKKLLRDHKRIIFNGNGYSHEWEQEAEKRGLCNLKSTVDALPCVLERKNIELFEEFGIFSEAEVRARYEVSLENYTKALHIEALTMLDMAKKQIVPAVAAYLGDLADTACSKKALSSALSTRAEETLLAKLSAGADMLVEKIDELQAAVDGASRGDSLQEAACYKDRVLPKMAELRAVADALELATGKDYWPFPTYADLLFGVN